MVLGSGVDLWVMGYVGSGGYFSGLSLEWYFMVWGWGRFRSCGFIFIWDIVGYLIIVNGLGWE